MRHLIIIVGATVPLAMAMNLPFLRAESNQVPARDLTHRVSLKLTKALHVGSRQQPGFLQKDFSEVDRLDLDAFAQSSSFVPTPPPELEESSGVPMYRTSHTLKSKKKKLWRPKANFQEWQEHRTRGLLRQRAGRGSLGATTRLESMGSNASKIMEWEGIDVDVPDVQDLETLRSLAMMTSNAYITAGSGSDWYDIDHWNISTSFGWDEDGIRGHVYAAEDNSTVVVSIKGTSAGLFGFGGSTGANDKINDNLLFSCCCARVDWTWSPVCGCYSSAYKCRQPCLEDSLIEKSVYFPIATSLFNNVSVIYPDSNIWLVGHSLGGGLASLLGMTFGLPVVAFEAPGDLLPAQRLHLPLPPGASWGDGQEGFEVTHVYHTADPIPMGVCNGALSLCSIAGFALETSCHVGQNIVYDTVNELNWGVDVRTHTIRTVIDHVVKEGWNAKPPSKTLDTVGTNALLQTDLSLSSPHSFWMTIKTYITSLWHHTFRVNGEFKWPWHWHWPWLKRRSPPSNDAGDGGDGGGGGHDDKNPNQWVPKVEPAKCDIPDCFRWEFVDDWSDSVKSCL